MEIRIFASSSNSSARQKRTKPDQENTCRRIPLHHEEPRDDLLLRPRWPNSDTECYREDKGERTSE